jgi:hypothetical protein
MLRPYNILLKRNLFHTPAFLTHELLQAFEHFGADARGVVGEIDQVP